MQDSNLDRDLDRLFLEYRAACPEVEPAPNFMPNLWQRIEVRRSVPLTMRRFAQVIVPAAAALCLVMALSLVAPSTNKAPILAQSYVEVLDSENPHEALVYSDVAPEPPGESRW